MNFFPLGPFDVPRSEKGLIQADNTLLKQFWTDVDEGGAGVSQAVGCYVFFDSGWPRAVALVCRISGKAKVRERVLHTSQACPVQRGDCWAKRNPCSYLFGETDSGRQIL